MCFSFATGNEQDKQNVMEISSPFVLILFLFVRSSSFVVAIVNSLDFFKANEQVHLTLVSIIKYFFRI